MSWPRDSECRTTIQDAFWSFCDSTGRKDESEGPPFELRAENSDHGPDWIDCETADDLECWLADLREADHY